MLPKLLIVGGGGLAKEVIALVRQIDANAELYILDDGLSKGSIVAGVEVVGAVDEIHIYDPEIYGVVVAIGLPEIREKTVQRIPSHYSFPTLIHPSVLIEDKERVLIDKGSILFAGVQLSTAISLGEFTILNTGVRLSHDTHIGGYSTLMHGVQVSSGGKFGGLTFIKAGAVISSYFETLPRTVIPANAVVDNLSLMAQSEGWHHWKIALSKPEMSGKEWAFMYHSMLSGQWGWSGGFIESFEEKLGEPLMGREVVALQSGTSALHLALEGLNVGPDDVVLCSNFTYVASASYIKHLGAQPVFIEADPVTWALDVRILEESIKVLIDEGKKPKALIAVHPYGMTCTMDEVMRICQENDIAVIEDAAEAIGSTYLGKQAGAFGDAAILSFNGNKMISTGNGGALLGYKELVDRAKYLSTQAKSPAPHYEHEELGYNYRMSNIQAAIGCAQLEDLDHRIKARREVFFKYQARLGGMKAISFQEEPNGYYSNRWLTCILIDPGRTHGKTREDVRLALEDENIESRPLWKPMHMQPVFKNERSFLNGTSEELFNRGLCLPSGSRLTDQEIDAVCAVIRKVVGS